MRKKSTLPSSERLLPETADALLKTGRAEWPWVRLGDHVTKVGSGLTPLGGHASYKTSGIPLIRSQNVHVNRFDSCGLACISPQQDEEMEGSRVQSGDVLLNITGASIGRCCVVPDDICPANVNQHVCIIRSDGSLDPAFLAFYLATPGFQKFILSSQAGATRQALTKGMIEGFRVPSPPLTEQRKIAARLKSQLMDVAEARAAVQGQVKTAKALPASVLRSVFGSPLVESGTCRPLGEVCELLQAKSISIAGDVEVRAITTACLTETGFEPSGIKVARMWARDVPESTVQPGEILVARSNTPELVGRVGVIPSWVHDTVATDLTIRIRTREELLSEFLAGYLSFLFVSGFWRERAGGASGSMKKITRTQIQAVSIPVPSILEQESTVARLQSQLAEAASLCDALKAKLAGIDRLPPTLLSSVFATSTY